MRNLIVKILHTGLAVLFVTPLLSQADDTDIYLGSAVNRSESTPNIIFVMDTSGSMAEEVIDPLTNETKTRLQTVKDVAIEVIEESAADPEKNFNIALMSFNLNNQGGSIDMPMTPLSDATTNFEEVMNAYISDGGTPITESLDEALRYLRGDTPLYGVNSVADSKENGDYKSPITSECQTNHIVLFSDGEPTADEESNSDILSKFNNLTSNRKDTLSSDINVHECNTLTDFKQYRLVDRYYGETVTDSAGVDYYFEQRYGGYYLYYYYDKAGSCAEELALLGQSIDLAPNAIPGIQTAIFHTVGGFTGANALAKLKNIALYGTPLEEDPSTGVLLEPHKIVDGNPVPKNYYSATNASELKTELTELFENISINSATFSAPSVSINSYNSLQRQNELYYSMFKPDSGASWQGNLKQYALNENGQVIDAGNNPIIGSDGKILDTARSFWTPENNPDGPNIPLGGAAQHLTKEHNIYTHLTANESALATKIEDTPAIREWMPTLNSMSPENILKTINWANRIDPSNAVDGTRKEMEDSLHSRPVVINYATTQDPITEEIITDSVVYMTTNSGYLHAFKATKVERDYEEYFSYVPKELLPNITKYANDIPLSKSELYGLDGYISYWFKDVNKNGQVDINGGDRVILYIGMRRGGNHYYALDVTNPDAPKYLWQIDGGTGDFERLGQSWSEMTLTKVPFNGEDRVVLLFGGGYDPTEDSATAANSDEELGNALYMVDALSGDLLWSASKSDHHLNKSDMTASFMNNIRLVDYNGDRVTDLFYVSDVAGRIWRFDIKKDNTGDSDFADGGIIFDANGDTSDSVYNRFYNSPSISYFKDESDAGFLTISIGTGFRASPLSASSDDAFYVLKDYDIVHKPASYIVRTPSDLAHFLIGESSARDVISNDNDVTKRQGWKFTLPTTSEKVLADALTTHGRIIFTTFTPNNTVSNSNPCNFNPGEAQAYTIDFQSDNDRLPAIERPLCQASGTCPEIPPLVPAIEVDVPTCEDLGTCEPPPPNCEEEGTCPAPPGCDDGGTAVLIGTTKLGETTSSCGILVKDYWLKRQ
jgi:type IV pilus assembly protein PilY1